MDASTTGLPGDEAAVLRFYMAADVVLVASLNEVLPRVICESSGRRDVEGSWRDVEGWSWRDVEG